MKKLFRFQYETCNGTCYAPEDKFFEELRKVDKETLNRIVNQIAAAHDSTCDDINQRFAVDYDEENEIYIGSFIDNGRLDLFSNKSFIVLVDDLTKYVLNYNKNKVIPADACKFGENGVENLAEMIIKSVA